MHLLFRQSLVKGRQLSRAVIVFAWTVGLVVCYEVHAAPYLLVNGQTSRNVVRFDLATGEATVFAEYPSGSRPRNLVVRDDGAVFASLLGGTRNVVRLVGQQGSSVRKAINFSPSISGLGTGQLAIYANDVFVAGDSARHIYRYDGQTGAEITHFTVTGSNNIRGMTIKDSTLYYAEIFQNTVRKFDLTQDPLVGETLFASSPFLDEPLHLAIGHTGNLIITSRESSLIQEFDPISGQFLRTFVDISDFEPVLTGNYMIEYVAAVGSYFVSTGLDRVYQLDQNGALVRTLQSDLLDEALSPAFFVPEPSTAALSLLGAVCCAGLAGRRRLAKALARSA